MPSSSFDTFFACTILVAAALIATAFLGTTMQARIAITEDINKDAYLQAIADRIVTSSGFPNDWGTSIDLPAAFGLATASAGGAYELDMDKVTRLNSLNDASLSYIGMMNAANLKNIALSLAFSQVMLVNVEQVNNFTAGDDTTVVFKVSTSINGKPTSANLHCYVVAGNYQHLVTAATLESGMQELSATVPTMQISDAYLVVFARATFNEGFTSYAIYSFADSIQQSTLDSATLGLSPLDYTLNYNDALPDVTVANGYVISYGYIQNLTITQNPHCPIPKLVDKSPLVLVVCGVNGGVHFQEWTVYPQIPLAAGSDFVNNEQNVFSYMVTVGGVLYKLDITLGDVPQ